VAIGRRRTILAAQAIRRTRRVPTICLMCVDA